METPNLLSSISIPSSMCAVVAEKKGETQPITIVENIRIPIIKPNQLLIKVYAAALNPIDTKMRKGKIPFLSFPLVLGREVSGVVVQIGIKVSKFKIGDEGKTLTEYNIHKHCVVFALLSYKSIGGQCEYTIADEGAVALKPKKMSHEEASGLALAGVTAWVSLFEKGKLQKGQKVLVHAGAGGVGSLAIQLAAHAGAHVATTCSARNIDFVKSLGAQEAIDYTSAKFDEQLEKESFDLVIDAVGGDTLERSYRVLKPTGKIVELIFAASVVYHMIGSIFSGQSFLPVMVSEHEHGSTLEKLAKLVDEGSLKIVIDGVYPLKDAKQAYEKMDGMHARGKVILQVADSKLSKEEETQSVKEKETVVQQ